MSENIWQELTNIFRSTLDDETLTLSENTTAKDVPGWDSITHVLLVVGVEKHFKIKLTAGEIQKLQNVGELVALIRAKRSVTGAK
jgi:acyl carrier protein